MYFSAKMSSLIQEAVSYYKKRKEMAIKNILGWYIDRRSFSKRFKLLRGIGNIAYLCIGTTRFKY